MAIAVMIIGSGLPLHVSSIIASSPSATFVFCDFARSATGKTCHDEVFKLTAPYAADRHFIASLRRVAAQSRRYRLIKV